MRKNVASQKIGAQMVSATDGSAFTGSVTIYVTGDAGTQAVGSVGSGACAHEGEGYHTYAPAQAETNYNLVAFTFKGTGAVPVTIQVETISFDPHDTVRLGLTALPNAAAEAAGGLYTRGTGAGQVNQPVNGMADVNVVRNAGTAITAAAGVQEVKVASVAAGANNAASYAADTNLYSAVCHLTDKNSATATDRYTVHWFLNGAVVTSGITLPTIQVVKVADGTDLVASVAMSEVGSTGVLKKDVTATLAVRGEAYYADLNATIGGSNRFFRATITRDVSA